MYADFELHGIDEEKLTCKTYSNVCKRIQLEETNASLSEGTTVKSKFGIFNGFGKAWHASRGFGKRGPEPGLDPK